MEGGLSKLSSLEMIPFEVFGTVEGEKSERPNVKIQDAQDF